MITSVTKLSTSWGQFLSFIFYIFSVTWILRPSNHLLVSILLCFQIVYKPNFHNLCLSFVVFGSTQSVFSMRYIYRDLVFHFLQRTSCFGSTHNMLAVIVIKSSMDQGGNWNKADYTINGNGELRLILCQVICDYTRSQLRMSNPVESNCFYCYRWEYILTRSFRIPEVCKDPSILIFLCGFCLHIKSAIKTFNFELIKFHENT